jgi:hypothetical protein
MSINCLSVAIVVQMSEQQNNAIDACGLLFSLCSLNHRRYLALLSSSGSCCDIGLVKLYSTCVPAGGEGEGAPAFQGPPMNLSVCQGKFAKRTTAQYRTYKYQKIIIRVCRRAITIVTSIQDFFTLSLVLSLASQLSLPRKIVAHPRTCHPREVV